MEIATHRPQNLASVKDAFVCLGVYFACALVSPFFAIVYDKLVQRTVYRGFFEIAVIMPLVQHFPRALFAVLAGIAVVYLVDPGRVWLWISFLAVLYAFLGLFGYHWSRPPVFADRLAQVIGTLFPAMACLFGAFVATRRPSPDPAH